MTGCGSDEGGGPSQPPTSENTDDGDSSNGDGDSSNIGEGDETITLQGFSLKALSSEMVADGESQVMIEATLTGSDDKPFSQGDVIFSTTAGSLNETSKTVSSGVARVYLTSPENVGRGIVTAFCNGHSASVQIDFIAGKPLRINASVTPTSLVANGISTAKLNVTVLDKNDNAVSGETLTFSCEAGTFSSFTKNVSGGMATNTYTAPTYVPNNGWDLITVESTAGVIGQAKVLLRGPIVSNLILETDSTSLPADGVSQLAIFAKVTGESGTTVSDGTKVSFSIPGPNGSGGSITPEAETTNGIAVATLTSGSQPMTVVVHAESGGRVAEKSFEFTPGSVEVSAIPNAILSTGDQTAQIVAKVLSTSGVPIKGEAVHFALKDTSLGSLSSSEQITNDFGEAKVIFTGSQEGGKATITATWDNNGVGVQGDGVVDVFFPPAFIKKTSDSPNPTAINVKGTGGQSTSQLSFEVRDAKGALVEDGYLIKFSIDSGPDGGEGILPMVAATSNGRVSTILRSGSKSGPVSVCATYKNNTSVSTSSSQIAISSGQPVGEELSLVSKHRNISGLFLSGLENIITFSAGDFYGNPIPDETALSFKTYNTGGLIQTESAITENGFSQTTLTTTVNPSPIKGMVSVTAEVNDGGRSTHVTSIAIAPEPYTDIMYVGTNGGGIYKSTDGGQNWKNTSRSSDTPEQNWLEPYINDVVIDPDNADTVYAATGFLGKGHIFRSLDGGSSWNSNNPWEWRGLVTLDASVTSLICDDSGSDYVWAGTRGRGVLISEDGKKFHAGGIVGEILFKKQQEDNSKDLSDKVTVFIQNNTARTERWTLTVETKYDDPSSAMFDDTTLWRVEGSISGPQKKKLVAGISYTTDKEDLFILIDPDSAYAVGDSLTIDIQSNGLGQSGNVTDLVKAAGTGKDATLYASTPSGVYKSINGGQTWSATADFTGSNVTCLASFSEDVIYAGTKDAGLWFTSNGGNEENEKDTWRQLPTFGSLSGEKVEALCIDSLNHRLYVATYFWAEDQEYATGDVYHTAIKADGTPSENDTWASFASKLPVYSDDNPTTLPPHALATNHPSGTCSLYVGGEGISLSKATFDSDGTVWNDSSRGLSNRLMVRTPILFSGECSMSIQEIYTPDDPNDPTIDTHMHTFIVYIQDKYGHPPVAGSSFVVSYRRLPYTETVFEVKYPDVLTYGGTFCNPTDPSTNRPFIITHKIPQGCDMSFVFEPLQSKEAPGSSGAENTVIFHSR